MTRLQEGYDVLLLDLDGTVFRGGRPVDGAREALDAATTPVRYVTNNASRSPSDVAAHLVELGFRADADAVVTSAQAGARVVARRIPAGSRVLVVGAEALADEVAALGLEPVRTADPVPAAVVQGHSPETGWPILAEAAYAIEGGAVWVATNTDSTLPTERGLAPGNGSMVAAVRHATGVEPIGGGKPAAPLMRDSIERGGSSRPLVVGDRLDTDIAGANTVSADSLLVLTGVSSAADLVGAPPEQRPTFVATSLAALDADPDSLTIGPRAGWDVDIDGATLTVSSTGPDGDPLDALRAAAHAAWTTDVVPVRIVGRDDAARAAVRAWDAAR